MPRPFSMAVGVLGVILALELIVISVALGKRKVDEPARPLVDSGILEALAEEAAALREENEWLLQSGQRIGVEDRFPAAPGDLSNVPQIRDPFALEKIAVAESLRDSGDMAGALEMLREAKVAIGEHPRLLHDIAGIFRKMGLDDKAAAEWRKLRDLGPSAGQYQEIAILELGASDATYTPARPDTALFISSALLRSGESSEGLRTTVRLAINSRLGPRLKVDQVAIDIQGYDLVGGKIIEQTVAEPPEWDWVTPPVDWGNPGTELLDVPYLIPTDRARGRRFFGFSAKLYYQDELQDVYLHPRTLHEELVRQADRSAAEVSLFPE